MPFVRLIWISPHGMPNAVCTALRCISLLTSALFWSALNLNLHNRHSTWAHSANTRETVDVERGSGNEGSNVLANVEAPLSSIHTPHCHTLSPLSLPLCSPLALGTHGARGLVDGEVTDGVV